MWLLLSPWVTGGGAASPCSEWADYTLCLDSLSSIQGLLAKRDQAITALRANESLQESRHAKLASEMNLNIQSLGSTLEEERQVVRYLRNLSADCSIRLERAENDTAFAQDRLTRQASRLVAFSEDYRELTNLSLGLVSRVEHRLTDVAATLNATVNMSRSALQTSERVSAFIVEQDFVRFMDNISARLNAIDSTLNTLTGEMKNQMTALSGLEKKLDEHIVSYGGKTQALHGVLDFIVSFLNRVNEFLSAWDDWDIATKGNGTSFVPNWTSLEQSGVVSPETCMDMEVLQWLLLFLGVFGVFGGAAVGSVWMWCCARRRRHDKTGQADLAKNA